MHIVDFADLPRQGVALGVPHPEFGEVPMVAVRGELSVQDRERIMQAVAGKLGPDYQLYDVKTLGEIGMDEFLVNQTGKVIKFALKEAVMRLK